jgi:MraZ protein
LRRYLFSGAQKAEIDKLGRILLPAQLKEYASISRNVAVIGAGDHFEIWDIKRWEAYSATLEEK